MKIGILGSRTLANHPDIYDKIYDILEEYKDDNPTVLHGGAEGVDQKTHRVCKQLSIDTVVLKPYFKLAKCPVKVDDFFIRNQQILDNSDLMILFSDEEHSDVRFIMEVAKKQRKKCIVLTYK